MNAIKPDPLPTRVDAPLGPTFAAELAAAGLDGLALVFDNAGVDIAPGTPAPTVAAVRAVVAAHDPAAAPADAYRAARRADYGAQLGKRRGEMEAVGDGLDVLFKELLARGPAVDPEFKAYADKVAAIKAAHPKP